MARTREDDIDPPRQRARGDEGHKELGPLDGLYLQMGTTAVIVLSILFNALAFVLGIICILTAKQRQAKENATRSVLVVIAVGVVGVILCAVYVIFFAEFKGFPF